MGLTRADQTLQPLVARCTLIAMTDIGASRCTYPSAFAAGAVQGVCEISSNVTVSVNSRSLSSEDHPFVVIKIH